MIQAHDHTSMTVGDMDVMLAFYRDHFNMNVLKLIENKNDDERAKGSGFEGLHMKIAHLALGGFVLEMVEYVNRKGAKLDMRPTNIGSHHMGFVCDDIHATVAELKARGVVFDGEVADAGFGLAVQLELPGGVCVQIYQPHYQKDAG